MSTTDTVYQRFTIRGPDLEQATGVTITPADGITISSTISVAVVGQQGLETDEVYVDLAIAPTAPVGDRVVRVLVPGLASSGDASPVDTLSIIQRPIPDTGGVCPGTQGGGG